MTLTTPRKGLNLIISCATSGSFSHKRFAMQHCFKRRSWQLCGDASAHAAAAAAAAAAAGAAAGPAAAMSYYTTNIIAAAAFVSVRRGLAIGGGASILPSSANLVINLAPRKMTGWEGALLELRGGGANDAASRPATAAAESRRVERAACNCRSVESNAILLEQLAVTTPISRAPDSCRPRLSPFPRPVATRPWISRADRASSWPRRTMDDNNICQVYRCRQSVVRRCEGNSSSGTGRGQAGVAAGRSVWTVSRLCKTKCVKQ
jgi:hypothetical protein